MRKLMIYSLFVGTFLFFSVPTVVSAVDPGVNVFEDFNFSGPRISLVTGRYEEEYLNPKDANDFRKIIKNYDGKSVKNDSISSLTIQQGFRVILTDNNDYKGQTLVVENRSNVVSPISLNGTLNYSTIEAAAVNNLSGFSMDNKTSSIIVEEIKYDPSSPIVYEDSEFGKASRPLGVGDYRKSQLPFGNDKISGIRVPKGYTVRMWDDDKYKDRNYTYVGPTTIPFLEGFNDKVSSMKIRYTGQAI